MVNRCTAGLLASTILAVGGAPPLNAQTSPSPAPADAASAGDPGAITAAPDTAQLEEIVVTAPKRSETLHDVPISVGAVE